jgi:hypothetical protein
MPARRYDGADDALTRVLASDQTSAEKSRVAHRPATAANVEDDVTALVAQYRLQS